MEKFDDIWIFLEQKFKTSVPAYMKNILKVCGYDNGITISSIVEEDIIYFESEVRNGNVSKYFNGNKDVLEGSTKSVDNFEFSRGHKRFLISIVDFMQNHLKQNGQDFFVPEVASRKLVTCAKKQPEEKGGLDRWKGQRETHLRNRLFELSNGNRAELQNLDLKIHTGILMSKIIMSLINIVPEMYAENMESINKKILANLIEIKKLGNNTLTVKEHEYEFNGAMEFEAIVKCPFCLKVITDFPNKNGKSTYSWSVSNFEEHLSNTHFSQVVDRESFALGAISLPMKMSLRPITEESSSSISDICPINRKGIVCHENHDRNSYSTPPIVECFDGEDQICCDTSKFESYNVQDEALNQSISSENKSDVSAESMTVFLEKRTTNVFQRKAFPKEHLATQTINVIQPKVGNYVICSLTINNSIEWPEQIPIVKNFVGLVCRLNASEIIELKFLTKNPYSKRIFRYPENVKISHVPKIQIVKILQDPYQNRRGEWVFKDKSVLDYIFEGM